MDRRTLKFNPFITALIAILLVAVLIYIFSKQPFDSVSQKIDELRNQVDKDLSRLKLAEQTRNDLISKAQKLFRALSIAVMTMFCLTNVLLVMIGFNFIDALEGTTLVVTLLGSISSLIVFNRISVNALLEMAQKKVIIWVYRRNGFDPDIISHLRTKISINQNEIEKLKLRLRTEAV